MKILDAYSMPLPEPYVEFLRKHLNGVEIALDLEEGRMAWYLKLAREFFENDWAISNSGPIPFDRIAQGFVIGSEDGDYLYLDPEDNFSVWIYFHDCAGVLKVAESFETLIEDKMTWLL